MSQIKEIREKIKGLLDEGIKLVNEPIDEIGTLAPIYESWYTRAYAVISQIIPERIDDFRIVYRNEKRKIISYETYTISDYLMGLVVRMNGDPIFDTTHSYQSKILRQISILKAAYDISSSVLYNIKSVIQLELIDNDINTSLELLKAGHLRSAGVVCGVALESHFKLVASRHGLTLKKSTPSISDWNDLFKDKVYDLPMWRLIQRLGDIRNLCAHSKDRDPLENEVQDLILGTQKVVKEVN
jgi:hypothetical protein